MRHCTMDNPPLSANRLMSVTLVLLLYIASDHRRGAGGGVSGFSLDGVRCGSKRCSVLESCSQYTALCQPCAEICPRGGHNHEADRCERDCQAYLLDQRYVLRADAAGGANNNNDFDVREELLRLRAEQRALVAACAVLGCVALLLVGGLFLWFARRNGLLRAQWFRDRLRNKKSDAPPTIMQNPHTSSPGLAGRKTAGQNNISANVGASSAEAAQANSGPAVLKLHIPTDHYGQHYQTSVTTTTTPHKLNTADSLTYYNRNQPSPPPSTVMSGWSTPGTETSNLASQSVVNNVNNNTNNTHNGGAFDTSPNSKMSATRHPAEDASLVGHAQMATPFNNSGGGGGGGYDNKGLNLTPSPLMTSGGIGKDNGVKHDSSF